MCDTNQSIESIKTEGVRRTQWMFQRARSPYECGRSHVDHQGMNQVRSFVFRMNCSTAHKKRC